MELRRNLNLNRLVAVFIILVAVAGLMAFLNHSTTKKSPAETVPADWVSFKNQQNGFQFSYPKSWGKANLTTNKDQGGNTHYVVSFVPAKATDIGKSIGISMDNGSCKNSCVTKDFVAKNLAVGKKNFVKYTDDSYAMVASLPDSKVDTMTYVKVVNIPKISVTAATLFFTRTNANNCPQNKLADSDKGGCITADDYDTVTKVLKSFQGV